MPDAREQPVARERFVRSGPANLYVRDVGQGLPIVVLHGGPDFDHQYLLPELDRLAERFRLVYYDQRGRGRSFSGEGPDDVTVAGELADIDQVREELGLGSVALLGHSWGGLLAMEYALGHPDRVSHLILMNTAPASHLDMLALRRNLREMRTPEQNERLAEIAASPAYEEGDIDTDAEFYRIYFGATLPRSEHLEQVIRRLRANSTRDRIVAARAIEHSLYAQTWSSEGYDLIPRLERLRIPTLLIHGDRDFVPVEVAEHIATAVPDSRLVVLAGCGHFAYLEQPDRVLAVISEFLESF